VIPATLDGWSLDAVRGLVEQGVFESDRFDFKETLAHPKDEDGKRRLRRDVCADPSVEWDFKNPPIPVGPGRVIHVVHVAASTRRPHGVFEDGRWCFTKRTNKGTEPLSYAELRGLFIDVEQRRANLLLFEAELHRLRELGEDQGRYVRSGGVEFLMVRFDTARLEGVLPSIFSFVSDHSWLVRHLDALRNAAQAANARLSGVSPYALLTAEIWDALRSAAIDDAVRVTKAAGVVLVLLKNAQA
jgi:hypothetical protein